MEGPGSSLYEGQSAGAKASPDNFKVEISAELDWAKTVSERTANNQDHSSESSERSSEQSLDASVRIDEIKLTHPDYMDTEPITEVDAAQREIVSILYRWTHLIGTGEYVTVQGELGAHIDENQPAKNGIVNETMRMMFPESQEKRMEAVEDLKELFEIPGVAGSSVVVTRPKDTYEPDREFSNVLGFRINQVGNVIIKHADPDREGLIVEQWIACIGAPDGCDIKFL